MIARALADARILLSGAGVQARCLECPATAPVRQRAETLPLRARLAALIWGS